MQKEPNLHPDSNDSNDGSAFDFEEMESENDIFILDPKCPCALHGYRQIEKIKIPDDEYISSEESVHEPIQTELSLVETSKPVKDNATNLDVHEENCQHCCNECDTVFNTRQHLFTHRKVVHLSRITCKYCKRTFSRRSNLKRHIDFTCPKNNLKKKNNEKLKSVLFALPFICDYCQKGYLHKKTLLSHIKRHLKDSEASLSLNNVNNNTKAQSPNIVVKIKYPCNECHNLYKSRQDLIIHLKVTHSGNVICKFCKKHFTKRTNLKRHQNYFCPKNKSKERNNEKLKYGMFLSRLICNHCNKSYTHKNTLITHIKSHIEAKSKYQCHLCEKNYTKKHNLNCHLQSVHYKIKKYSCKYCKEKFAWRAGVISHEKTYH